jgi:hypothetical protein
VGVCDGIMIRMVVLARSLCVTGLTGRGHRSDRSEGWPCSHVAEDHVWFEDQWLVAS